MKISFGGASGIVGAPERRGEKAAQKLVVFARTNHLGMLSFRENIQDRNARMGPLYQCTNIKQKPYEFSKISAGYGG
ncbi:MAG: hypothetical protein E6F99_25725 [Actinobacteria bacterium]|nr:MAG: hypothetical protein E6F99_25725 [Actinomycetota bacterium]